MPKLSKRPFVEKSAACADIFWTGFLTVLIHLLLNRTEYYQLQIVSKKLTKMHTHLCIDIRVVLLFVNRTGKLLEVSADEKSWWWLKISSTVDAEKFF